MDARRHIWLRLKEHYSTIATTVTIGYIFEGIEKWFYIDRLHKTLLLDEYMKIEETGSMLFIHTSSKCASDMHDSDVNNEEFLNRRNSVF